MTRPLRLCLFTPTFLPLVGGAERDADLVVRRLNERGHEVMVLAQDAGSTEHDLPYPVRRYRRLPSQHLWPELLSRSLAKAHEEWSFDCVLAWYGYPNGYAASRIKRKKNFALVVSPRGGDLYPMYHALKKPRVASIIGAGYRGADRIVSISHWLTERLHIVAGEPLPPIDLVYNGIDLAEHDALRDESRRNPPSLPVEKPFILHLARVAPVKQQTLAVQAIAKMRETFESAGLVYAIVGSGHGVDDVQQLIDQHKLGETVKLLGTRTGVEKAWLYDNAEFMVSTSREEGLGNVVLEAMSSGLPMLGSDIGPHRELIGQREWGMLFKSGDVDDLVRAFGEMIHADRSAWQERAIAERDAFTLDRMIDGYEASCLKARDEHVR